MVTRRPFASLLAVAGLAVALALALLVAALPGPMQTAVKHCVDAGGTCRTLLLAARSAGGPVLLTLLLAYIAWAVQGGLREGWRQWRATQAALNYLGAQGRYAPSEDLAALCADLGIAGRVEVIVSARPLALCHGLWRPRIWLSTGALTMLGRAEMRAVLCHERAHQRRRDPLRLLVARCCAVALPYLPVLKELADALPLAQELAADRAAMRAGARDALGRALLTLANARMDGAAPALATGMVSCLDARIDQLMGATVAQPRLSHRALAHTGRVFGAGLLVFILLMTSRPAGPVAPHGSRSSSPRLYPDIVAARTVWEGISSTAPTLTARPRPEDIQ